MTSSMAERLKIEPGEEPLAELRSTGQQTMVPPSIHPVDGDRCLWHPGNICKIDGADLVERVLDVAVAALLALNFPLGSRQLFAIHAASYLSRHVERDRVKTIVGAASEVIEDEEHDERMVAVQDFLWGPSNANPTRSMTMTAELERLAPGVPALISRWCERGRRDRGGAR